MRILTQNLQHGGGGRIDQLVARIGAHEPDIVVFTEFRRTKLEQLTHACLLIGLNHIAHNAPKPSANSVAVAARAPVAVEDISPFGDRELPGHLLKVALGEFALVATYIPIHRNFDTPAYFERLTDVARIEPILILGDLNSGNPERDGDGYKFKYRREFKKLIETGLIDCFRTLLGGGDVSWKHPRGTGRGFRIDHALVSPGIAKRVDNVVYDHSIRQDRLSDHSALLVDIAVSAMP